MAGVYGAASTSVRSCAAALLPYVGEDMLVEDVADFLTQLGGIGAGLQELLEISPSLGKLFGAIFSLHMLGELALVNRNCCATACNLGQEVLLLLDYTGRRGGDVDCGMLIALVASFEDFCNLADGFCKHGWLLRVVCDLTIKDTFTKLHDDIVTMLKSDSLMSLPNGRGLPLPDYRDSTKALRRALKQKGQGNVTAGAIFCSTDVDGLYSLRDDEASLREVASMLEVEPQLLREEVARIPHSELDLDVMYGKLLQHSPNLQQHSLEDSTNGIISPEVNSILSSVAAATPAEVACSPDRAPAELQGHGEGSAPGMENKLYAELFAYYDKDNNGVLDETELQVVLSDLGVLDGKSPREAVRITASHMQVAAAACGEAGDSSCNVLSPLAFSKLYGMLVMTNARQKLRFKLGLQAEDELKGVFVMFASFGSRELMEEMDGAHFQKLCRDCGLLSRPAINTTVVDITFTKVKTKGARKITFDQFLTALAVLAEKKGVPFEAAVLKVLDANGPIAHATKAEAVRLHDDKSSYTGVYARGGPSTSCTSPQFDLAAYLDRSVPHGGLSCSSSSTGVAHKKAANNIRGNSSR
eukprot:gene4265-4517_t